MYLSIQFTNICMAYFFAFINITIQLARYAYTRMSLGYTTWEIGGSQGIQILISIKNAQVSSIGSPYQFISNI